MAILGDIVSTATPVRRRQDIVFEGRRSRSVYLVVDGLLIRYRVMRNGHRQIVNIVVPGDVAGAPSCFFDVALYSVRTLTNAVVAEISLDTLSSLLDTHPPLATKLFWLFSCDAALCAEHVVVLGRRSARERIAHFFLELLTRLREVGLADENSFQMPFSQDVIGDALGLSLAYVNRELRTLKEDGIIVTDNHKVVVRDVKTLSELADFQYRYLKPSPASEFFTSRRAPWQKVAGAPALIRGTTGVQH
jgi:CRP-like cAMP-binding protein